MESAADQSAAQLPQAHAAKIPISTRARATFGLVRQTALFRPGFHRQMALASLGILIFTIVGSRLTLIDIPHPGDLWTATLLAVAAASPIPLYWHDKGKTQLRDASLVIPWALVLAVLLPFPVSIVARMGAGMSLQDSGFRAMDQALGVNVHSIAAWGSSHWLGSLANGSYPS